MKMTQLCSIAAVFGLTVANLCSQPQTEEPKTSAALIQAMKAANSDILKQQEKTLETLDTLQKEAEQLKIFSKRS
jgi:hypothetical protein